MRRLKPTILIGGWLVACSFGPLPVPDTRPPALIAAHQQVNAQFEVCMHEYDYDPDKGPERGLAPGEREARACAYKAIETLLMPVSPVPEKYEGMIRADQNLTDRLAAGSISRSERRKKIQKINAEIQLLEQERSLPPDEKASIEAQGDKEQFTRHMIQMMR